MSRSCAMVCDLETLQGTSVPMEVDLVWRQRRLPPAKRRRTEAPEAEIDLGELWVRMHRFQERSSHVILGSEISNTVCNKSLYMFDI